MARLGNKRSFEVTGFYFMLETFFVKTSTKKKEYSISRISSRIYTLIRCWAK